MSSWVPSKKAGKEGVGKWVFLFNISKTVSMLGRFWQLFWTQSNPIWIQRLTWSLGHLSHRHRSITSASGFFSLYCFQTYSKFTYYLLVLLLEWSFALRHLLIVLRKTSLTVCTRFSWLDCAYCGIVDPATISRISRP